MAFVRLVMAVGGGILFIAALIGVYYLLSFAVLALVGRVLPLTGRRIRRRPREADRRG